MKALLILAMIGCVICGIGIIVIWRQLERAFEMLDIEDVESD